VYNVVMTAADPSPLVRTVMAAIGAARAEATAADHIQRRYWLLEAHLPDIETEATVWARLAIYD
jgi:hypothetical protein